MIDTTKCWEWGGTRRKGDNRALANNTYAYRLVYEAATGEPCPPGSAHHTCENPACINPWHLEFLMQAKHMKAHGHVGGDWGQADKTHCVNNHPYSDENTYRYTRKDGTKERHCQICRREAKARYKKKITG